MISACLCCGYCSCICVEVDVITGISILDSVNTTVDYENIVTVAAVQDVISCAADYSIVTVTA